VGATGEMEGGGRSIFQPLRPPQSLSPSNTSQIIPFPSFSFQPPSPPLTPLFFLLTATLHPPPPSKASNPLHPESDRERMVSPIPHPPKQRTCVFCGISLKPVSV
jgi:hypothetical protein